MQGNHLAGYNGSVDIPPGLEDPVYHNNNSCGAGEFSSQHCGVDPNLQRRDSSAVVADQPGDAVLNNGFGSQDSFGRWVNNFISDSPGSVDDPSLEAVYTPGQDSSTTPDVYHSQSNVPEQVFNITDVSPAWAYSTEKTKVSRIIPYFLIDLFYYSPVVGPITEQKLAFMELLFYHDAQGKERMHSLDFDLKEESNDSKSKSAN